MAIATEFAAAVLAAAAMTGASRDFTSASASSSSTTSPTGVTQSLSSDSDRKKVDEVNAAASRGVVVANMNGDTMRLRSVTGDQWFEGPAGGWREIAPGGEHRCELQLLWMRYKNETVTHDFIRPDGSTEYAVTLTDPPGAVRDLNGSGPSAAAVDVLQTLCKAGKATCDFKAATSQEKKWGLLNQMGSKLGDVANLSKTVTVTGSWASSDSLGGSVSLKIPIAPVELTLQATYNHTWTQTHTVAESVYRSKRRLLTRDGWSSGHRTYGTSERSS